MRKLRIIPALPVLALGALSSMSATAQSLSPEAFGVMDIDGNGQIDAAEHGVAMGAAFAHADTNADGVLNAEEAAVLALPAQVDADGDGQVTLNEFLQSARSDFEAADKDGDGVLLP
jgi:Ca2+-binding EF-hand superfamily protein